jgi:hypothetical protein
MMPSMKEADPHGSGEIVGRRMSCPWRQRSSLYRNMDDLEQSKRHDREAVRLKPDSVWAHNDLGSV